MDLLSKSFSDGNIIANAPIPRELIKDPQHWQKQLEKVRELKTRFFSKGTLQVKPKTEPQNNARAQAMALLIQNQKAVL